MLPFRPFMHSTVFMQLLRLQLNVSIVKDSPSTVGGYNLGKTFSYINELICQINGK